MKNTNIEHYEKRFRGLKAAQKRIKEQVELARAANQPNGKRYGIGKEYWEGRFSGLVTALSILALADYPEITVNAEEIKTILNEKQT